MGKLSEETKISWRERGSNYNYLLIHAGSGGRCIKRSGTGTKPGQIGKEA